MTETFAAGAYAVQVMKINAAGYPVGQVADPATLTPGVPALHSYVSQHVVEVTPPTTTRVTATHYAGMKINSTQDLGVSDLGTIALTMGSFDDALIALSSGGSIDSTAMGTLNPGVGPNAYETDLPTLMIIFTRGEKKASGTKGYRHFAFIGTMRLLPSGANQNGGTNPTAVQFEITLQSIVRLPSGILISASGLGVQDDTDAYFSWWTKERIAISTYIDDGSATSFAVGYRPTKTDSDNSYNVFTKNGVDAASSVSAVSATTGAVTITAGTSADVWVSVYYTNYRAI